MRAPDTDDPVLVFLESAVGAKLEADRRKQRADELEWRATRMTAQLSADPKGGGADQQEILAMLADARTEELNAIRAAEKQRKKVEEFVSKITPTVLREIIALRYLSCADWNTVQRKLRAVGLYYSDRHLSRLHDAALERARALWVCETAEEGRGETG